MVDPLQAVPRLEAVLARYEQHGFTGQVLIAKGDEALLLRGFGRTRPGGGQAVTPQSVMPLASITKPFTASAILALEADGLLRLVDPVVRHLPELPKAWSTVTVEQLLTHTAGLPAEIDIRAWPGHPRFDPVERDKFIAGLAEFQPRHAPGTVFNYSNVGYSLLGALIERVSGRSWEDFLHTRLLAPNGIEDIGFLGPGWPTERHVHGRARGQDRGSYFDQPRLADGVGWRLRASGDLQASAAGMLEWWRSIRRGSWLPAEAMSAWTTPRVPEADGSHYGYGLHLRATAVGQVIGHTGGDAAFTADWSWLTGHDLVIFVASADPDHPADALRETLLRQLGLN